MTEDRAALEEEAIGWVIRTRDPGFADWESFTAWLEQSEAHARLYASLSLAEAESADHLPRSPAAVVRTPALPGPAVRPRRWWVGGAVAASAAAAALLFTTIERNPFPTREYVTAPGEKRIVQLADGRRVGRVVYEGASRGQVAEDLSRTLGLDVAADRGLAARPFSGIIQIEGEG